MCKGEGKGGTFLCTFPATSCGCSRLTTNGGSLGATARPSVSGEAPVQAPLQSYRARPHSPATRWNLHRVDPHPALWLTAAAPPPRVRQALQHRNRGWHSKRRVATMTTIVGRRRRRAAETDVPPDARVVAQDGVSTGIVSNVVGPSPPRLLLPSREPPLSFSLLKSRPNRPVQQEQMTAAWSPTRGLLTSSSAGAPSPCNSVRGCDGERYAPGAVTVPEDGSPSQQQQRQRQRQMGREARREARRAARSAAVVANAPLPASRTVTCRRRHRGGSRERTVWRVAAAMSGVNRGGIYGKKDRRQRLPARRRGKGNALPPRRGPHCHCGRRPLWPQWRRRPLPPPSPHVGQPPRHLQAPSPRSDIAATASAAARRVNAVAVDADATATRFAPLGSSNCRRASSDEAGRPTRERRGVGRATGSCRRVVSVLQQPQRRQRQRQSQRQPRRRDTAADAHRAGTLCRRSPPPTPRRPSSGQSTGGEWPRALPAPAPRAAPPPRLHPPLPQSASCRRGPNQAVMAAD